LKQLDITSFTVDMDDSISFVEAGAKPRPEDETADVVSADDYRRAAGD
jgi:hypothetical protein